MTAVYIGKLQGASGALLTVLVDGAQAAQWPGWDGNEDGRNRTILGGWRETETGLEADVGSAGSASIWRVGDDIVFLDFFPDDDFEDETPEGRRQLAKRVATLPTRGKPRSQGFVQIESGCIAAMLAYAEAAGATKALKGGAKKLTSFHDHGVLIPLANGRYEVLTENLGRTADGHSDEIGACVTRTRIRRAVAKPKPAPRLPPPKAGTVDILGEKSTWWGWTRGIAPFEFISLDAEDAPRYDGDGDFERSFKITGSKQGGGPMTTKAGARGVAGILGFGLAVTYWKLPAGVGLLGLDYDPKRLDLASKSGREALGAYFAQLPSAKSTCLGTVTVRSGALCVMRTMAYPPTAPRPSGDEPKVIMQGQGYEVGAAFPVENGVYEVHRDTLGDPKKGVMTEVGRIHVRVRFLRTTQTTAVPKPRAKAKPAASAKGRVHLELSDAKKFWEAWVEGSTLYMRFGRNGADGQTKLKKLSTPRAAAAERDALVAAKRKQGFA